MSSVLTALALVAVGYLIGSLPWGYWLPLWLKGVDIRTVGLLCGIDLEPIADRPGGRGFEALERSYHELDLYIRVTGDTLIVAPPLVLDAGSLGEIRDKTAKLLSSLS